MRRFLGQFAIPVRITDDAGEMRRVFNPWGPVGDLDADVAPIAELVVNDIVARPNGADDSGILMGLFLGMVPAVWSGLNKAGILPPFPEYVRFALVPIWGMIVWWIMASDQRDQVAPRLFAYGRCGCCGYRFRELTPNEKGQIQCVECSACWNSSRLGLLQEPPRTIGDSKLTTSDGGIFDADWQFRPVPNMRLLRGDRIVGEMATKAWLAAIDSRHSHVLFLSALCIGLCVLAFYGAAPPLTASSYLYFAAMVFAVGIVIWRVNNVLTGRVATGMKYQAPVILNAGRCPCCLSELPEEGEEPRRCTACGSRWWRELRKGQVK